MAIVVTVDDPIVTFNVGNPQSLTSAFSIRSNDLGASNGTLNVFGLNFGTTVDSLGFVTIPSNHPIGKYSFTYSVTDTNDIESNISTVTYYVVKMEASSASQISPIGIIPLGVSKVLVPSEVFGTAFQGIFNNLPDVQDDLIVEVWLESNPNVHLLRTVHQYLQETSLNPLAWDYSFTPTTEGPDRVFVQYGYSSFGFQVSQSFNVQKMYYSQVESIYPSENVTVIEPTTSIVTTTTILTVTVVVFFVLTLLLLLL